MKSALSNFSKCNVSSKTKNWYQNILFVYFQDGIWKKNFCRIWCLHPRIFQNGQVSLKTKNFKFETYNALFGYFRGRVWKTYCQIWNKHPKFRAKQKTSNLGPKMPYLGIFELQFWKTSVILEITAPEFAKIKSFGKNKNP